MSSPLGSSGGSRTCAEQPTNGGRRSRRPTLRVAPSSAAWCGSPTRPDAGEGTQRPTTCGAASTETVVSAEPVHARYAADRWMPPTGSSSAHITARLARVRCCLYSVVGWRGRSTPASSVDWQGDAPAAHARVAPTTRAGAPPSGHRPAPRPLHRVSLPGVRDVAGGCRPASWRLSTLPRPGSAHRPAEPCLPAAGESSPAERSLAGRAAVERGGRCCSLAARERTRQRPFARRRRYRRRQRIRHTTLSAIGGRA